MTLEVTPARAAADRPVRLAVLDDEVEITRMLGNYLGSQGFRGREAGPCELTVDVQIGRLRRKIELDAEDPQIIKSVRGAGYLFVPTVILA